MTGKIKFDGTVNDIPEEYRVLCGRCGAEKDMRAWCTCIPQEEIDEFNRKMMSNDWTPRENVQ